MHKNTEKPGSPVATKSGGTHPAPVPAVSRRTGDGEMTETGRSKDSAAGDSASGRPDPTRYGDWERNGRCIDF